MNQPNPNEEDFFSQLAEEKQEGEFSLMIALITFAIVLTLLFIWVG